MISTQSKTNIIENVNEITFCFSVFLIDCHWRK